MERKTNQCPEFSFYGARYPDARCIDGFLWDLDSYNDGFLTSGGEHPCPFCNSEAVIEDWIENEEGTKEELQLKIEKFWASHNYKP